MLVTKIKNFAAEDSAENSIMQTISIAVSAILIAAGLITAPSLINNARDVNAKQDLANLAYAQEYALSNTGHYAGTLANLKTATTSTSTSDLQGGVKATYSTDAITIALTNDANAAAKADESDATHYKAVVTSKSGKKFQRTDLSTAVTEVTP